MSEAVESVKKEKKPKQAVDSHPSSRSDGWLLKLSFATIAVLLAYIIFEVKYQPELKKEIVFERVVETSTVVSTVESTITLNPTSTVEKTVTSTVTSALKDVALDNQDTETQFQNSTSGLVDPTIQIFHRPDNYKMPFTDYQQKVIHPEDDGIKENGVIVTLARNSDLFTLIATIRDVEDRFNHRYHYDWVFLNDVEFTEEFKNVTSNLISGKTKYGLIPKEHWSIPDDIDLDRFERVRDELTEQDILYGESVSYRHMCRFQSGFFWRHPLLDEYDYYWRVDSDIKIFCDVPYDIFKFMRVNDKKYGFILSLTDYEETIRTIWNTTKQFTAENPQYVHENNLIDFISDDGGETFNRCHFWTNFEVASLDFFRSDAYRDYFEYLDKAGGFFYERWGDAPIHSIAASLFLDRSEVHFFDGLGFYHPDFHSCPSESSIRYQNKCTCDPTKDVTWFSFYFCTRQFFKAQHYDLPPGIIPLD